MGVVVVLVSLVPGSPRTLSGGTVMHLPSASLDSESISQSLLGDHQTSTQSTNDDRQPDSQNSPGGHKIQNRAAMDYISTEIRHLIKMLKEEHLLGQKVSITLWVISAGEELEFCHFT